MTLLFMDGFDVKDAISKWDGFGPNYSGAFAGRFGGFAIGTNQYEGQQIAKKTFAASAKITIGVALYTGTSIPITGRIIQLMGDSGATEHLRLHFDGANSRWQIYLGATGTLLASGPVGSVSIGTWNYVEISATINATTGICVVHNNGVEQINFTGNTRNGGTNSTFDTVWFWASSQYSLIDDLYICDGLGSVNNTFLGDVRVQTLLPMGTGSSTQLTPTGVANNWDNVNDVPLVTTTFNASSTVGQRDTYAMSDLIAGTGTIFGVQETIYAAKSDAGAASIKAAVKSGATVYYDPTQALSVGSVRYTAVRETDPATAAAWTVANLNAMEFGAEVA